MERAIEEADERETHRIVVVRGDKDGAGSCARLDEFGGGRLVVGELEPLDRGEQRTGAAFDFRQQRVFRRARPPDGVAMASGREVVPSRRAVAAATSAWRIRLSPTRNAPMPTACRRAMSAGVEMPLSPTSTRSLGTIGASVSLTLSVVSKVRRSRLLMPIRRD